MLTRNLSGRLLTVFAIVALIWFAGCKPNENNERTWSVYKADANSSSYSPLDQINVSNVSQLKPAWTFTINDLPATAQPASSQCNPIIVDGVLYATSAKRWAYAVNAATGEQIWSYDPFDGGGGGGVGRGVTYWESGDDKRILFAGGNHLIALDARTGKPIETFGEKGKVDLNVGVRDDPEKYCCDDDLARNHLQRSDHRGLQVTRSIWHTTWLHSCVQLQNRRTCLDFSYHTTPRRTRI